MKVVKLYEVKCFVAVAANKDIERIVGCNKAGFYYCQRGVHEKQAVQRELR